MSEYDSLIEGYDSSLPKEDPGPLSDEEHQALEEMLVPGSLMKVLEEEIIEAPLIDLTDPASDLRALKPDQRPYVGQHYVVFGGKPCPVRRDAVSFTEDEFVRSNLGLPDSLKDHDGQRQARAERTLRMRYRGYLSGEISTL